jgi:IclR family transcriptional regulator, acetate operon repressor
LGTVSKAMTLLESFSASAPEIGLSDLARAAAFDKATALRLLGSLAKHGMVEKVAATKRYRIGPAVVRLARIRAANVPLVEAARPILERLCAETGESCHVTEAAPGAMTSVLAIESPRALRVSLEEGRDIPFHCTASGLAYLAFGPGEVLERILKNPLPRLTPHTRIRAAEIRLDIEDIRKRGYAINRGGFDAETASAAAPILDSGGVALGAVSVAAPQSRTGRKSLAKHGLLAMRAAKDIAAALGGHAIRTDGRRA